MEVLIIFAFFCLTIQNMVLLRAVERPRREKEADEAIGKALEEASDSEASYAENESNKKFNEGVENIMAYDIQTARKGGAE